MSFINKIFSRALSIAGTTAKIATGGTLSRMALGGALGVAYGAATNQYDDPNMAMGRAFKMGLFGAAMGGATRLFTPAVTWGAKMSMSGMPLGLKAMRGMIPSLSTARGAGRFAMNTTNFMINHPLITAGAIGGAYAAYQFNQTPYDSDFASSTINQPFVTANEGLEGVRASREAQMIEQMNSSVAPMGGIYGGTAIRNQRLMQSTNGLTQGLHRGRHG